MKKKSPQLKIKNMRRSLITFLVLFILSSASQAQVTNEIRIAKMVKDFNSAIIARDSSVLAEISLDELTYGHSAGHFQDKTTFIKSVLIGPTFFKSIEPEDQTIKINGRHAIVRHVVVANATREGAPVALRFGNVMVFYKKHGKWRLLARQGFKL
jgi:ketosteroid isomerase-like protein